MIGIVIAASAYRWNPRIAQRMICHAVKSTRTHTVVIDVSAVERAATDVSPEGDFVVRIEQLPLSKCLKAGRPDARAIRLLAGSVPAERIVLLDAVAYPADLISGVLVLARQAWFHLEEWHPAFVLVCDNFEILRFAKELAGTFHIQPKTLAEDEVECIVQTMRRRALVLRWLGVGQIRHMLRRMYRGCSRLRPKLG